jgi:glutaminase
LEAFAESTSIKSEKRFIFEFEYLSQIELDGEPDNLKERFKKVFTNQGFHLDDPRIKGIIDTIDSLDKDTDLNFETFKELVTPISTFFRNIIQNQVSIPYIESFREETQEIFNKYEGQDLGGSIDSFLAETSDIKEDVWAASICTVEGQRVDFGDVNQTVPLEQISSVISYLIAMEQHGQESLSQLIGTEPSGKAFDNLELKDGVPHNPLISSGNLLCCSLINQEETIDRKYENYETIVKKLIGSKPVSFDNALYLNKKDNAHKNYCLLYMLQESGTIPAKTDVKQVMNFFTQTSSIEIKVSDYATLAASLANGGICPLTYEKVFSDSEAVKGTLSQMLCCGMNTFSGKWAFDVGLPAKSATTGTIILIVPNKMGIAVWSPKLNHEGNSIKGQKFLVDLIDNFGYNDIDHVYGAGLMKKILANLQLGTAGQSDSISLLYYTKQNKIRDIRKAVAKGCRVTFADYDLRTPLHIACTYGHLEIAKYYVHHGARIQVKDRFGNSPLDEAEKGGFSEIVEFLKDALKTPEQE